MTKTIYTLLIAFIFLIGCKENKPQPKEAETEVISNIIDKSAIQRLDSTLQSFVKSGNISGISALVFEKDKEVYFNAFGYADGEDSTLMDRNTIVKIYSMTKPITGTALMSLFEKDSFKLDDPLTKYAPEFENMKVATSFDSIAGKLILEDVKRPITIRDLTRHTAGFGNANNIPELGQLLRETNAMDKENTLTQMAEKMGKTPLAFHPNEQWSYGSSVDVQAFLVERISGKPYHEYVREHVLDPLKMTDTRYVVPESDWNRLAASYNRSEEGVLTKIPDEDAFNENMKKWPLTRGGWGLTSTVDDYMRFARMLVKKGTLEEATILKPETIELMATSHLDESIEKRSWLPSKGQVGFGIDFAVRLRPPANAEENNGVVGEFFWDGAASTLFWVDPVNELTAVLFVQLFPYDKIGLHKKFRDAVYGPYKEATSEAEDTVEK